MTSAKLQTVPAARSASRQIELRGVRVHNLKQVDLDVPLGSLVVFSGVSGSGKSSLAFDTLFAEGQRRYIESFSAAARQYLERIERPNADRIAHVPPSIAIRTDATSRASTLRTSVASLIEVDASLRRLFARIGHVICPDCQIEVRPQSPADIVQAVAMLPAGARFQICFTPAVDHASNPTDWLARGFSRAISLGKTVSLEGLDPAVVSQIHGLIVDRLVAGKVTDERLAESAETAFREGNGRLFLLIETSQNSDQSEMITIDDRSWLVHRFGRHWECSRCHREFLPPNPRLFEPEFAGGCPACSASPSDPITPTCDTCHGTRVCPAGLAVQVNGKSIADFLQSTIRQAFVLTEATETAVTPTERLQSELIFADIRRRLQTTVDIGSGYLTLLRSAQTLSGGEIRRLMLASAIGSRVTGTLCLVDEPSAGLHSSEIPRIVDALRRLVAHRNSVIVVEHESQIIRAADRVVDIGPGAGPAGGTIVFAGTPDDLCQVEQSATAQALRSEATLLSRTRSRRAATDWLTLESCAKANERDLRRRTLLASPMKFPLGVLCAVSGPGGSGKTTLVLETLAPVLRHRIDSSLAGVDGFAVHGGKSLTEVAIVDASPLTRSSRSNAATWIEIFDEIRDVFAMSSDAKQRGFGPQHFSFNAAQGGRCRSCRGTGILRHDMQFMPDVTLTCPECGGTRYRREILDVKYRGKSIADVLAMSAAEASLFFRNHARLQGRLQVLKQIGLDYLVLGQPTDTLSGGEAQRLRLAAKLTSSRGPTLIVCDEATVGLHPADISRLVACFDELLGIGHSILVIDNSPWLLSAADFVIELPAPPAD